MEVTTIRMGRALVRIARWLLVRVAWVVAIPVLLALLVFCAVMALVAEGPAALLWWVDWRFWRDRS